MTTYHNFGVRPIGGLQVCLQAITSIYEHLDRECRTCGYFWPEACVDDTIKHGDATTQFFDPTEWQR